MRALVLSTIPRFGYQVTVSLGLAGTRAYVVGDEPWPMVRLSRHCSGYTQADRSELQEGTEPLMGRLAAICDRHAIDVVIPADMRCTRMLARRKSLLRSGTLFPLPELELIDQLHNKWEFSRFLEKRGLRAPETRLLESLEEIPKLDVPFPLIVKPLEGENGVGVARIDSPDELREHVLVSGGETVLPLLIQEWLPGRDIDFSLLADRGEVVAWTVQQRSETHPGQIDFSREPNVVEMGKEIARASGYHGVAHIDMRIDSRTGDVNVIELNPRFWGSLLWSVWSGVNFPQLGMMLALGQDPRPHFSSIDGSCTHTGFAPRRLLRSLLRGRWMPEGLSPATQVAWTTNHSDPLPLLWSRLTARRR